MHKGIQARFLKAGRGEEMRIAKPTASAALLPCCIKEGEPVPGLLKDRVFQTLVLHLSLFSSHICVFRATFLPSQQLREKKAAPKNNRAALTAVSHHSTKRQQPWQEAAARPSASHVHGPGSWCWALPPP